MTNTFINNVLKYKKQFIRESKAAEPIFCLKRIISRLQKPKKLRTYILRNVGVIAEIKRRSPSRKFPNVVNIPKLAREYEKNSASAISILTDKEFFNGSILDIRLVKENVTIPILRKDFIVDEYQVYQSRAYGADAILLIASILSRAKIKELLKLTTDLGMEVLLEVHNEPELDMVIDAAHSYSRNCVMGINNRNLSTLEVDLKTSYHLLPLIPDSFVKVVESGIKTFSQIESFRRCGADGFLIGEALLTAKSPGKKLKELCYG